MQSRADSRHRTGRIASAVVALCVLPIAGDARAQVFYHDDPLTAEPPLYDTVEPQARALSEILELVSNTVGSPGERHPASGVIEARGVNTLGEVLDGPWFVNRHARTRLGQDELAAGPGAEHAPADGAWRVLTVRPFGVRPGLLVADARDRLYLLLFDPPDSPELSTGAQMVGSRIAHAIGYHVPETHLVSFDRERLVVGEGAEIVSSAGNVRPLAALDIDVFLRGVARTALGRYRAVALFASPESWRGLLGPYQVFATRSDDPNDTVPHEHRRDLRGLWVISAWINHSAYRAVATHDVLVEEDGAQFIKHFIVDHFASLGSGYREAKRAQEGNDPFFDGGSALRNIAGFGFWSPGWMRARYPGIPAVGRFEAERFDPARWTTTEGVAPFENRLPDDVFWGVRQVLAFTDEDLHTLVATGQYTDPEAAEWIVATLIARRDRIARAFLDDLLPLDRFQVEDGRLGFDDLAVRHGVADGPRSYTVRWSRLHNDTGARVQLGAPESFAVPDQVMAAPAGDYFSARIQAAGGDPERDVMVTLRTTTGAPEVVGIDRGWPGKVVADPRQQEDTGESRYASLTPEQRTLYAPFAEADSAARGRAMTVQEHFDAQSISERTTYDAVTHALMSSQLTDAEGNDLGTAFALVAGLERVAGQYYGRGGDQQFRLYVELVPDAVERLEQSTQFFEGHLNTVYHVGYPYSFRQEGDVPNMQISVSEDGLRADIDVDYRASKTPQSLFNGHLTSANSDVRAGDNLERHNARWDGMIGWWRDVFGTVPDGQEGPRDMLAAAAVEVPTPLPPDRPVGASIAAPEDAVQEFLTDWLVRRRVEDALAAVSSRAYACVDMDDLAGYEALGAGAARAALRDIMQYALDEMGEMHDLTEAVDAVAPFDPDRQLIPHTFDGEFVMAELSAAEATRYLCGQEAEQSAEASFHGVLFRFKPRNGGALGLLWGREDGEWRLVSYLVFEM